MAFNEARKPAPAALVLGVLAGILAAIAVVPTAIPLTLRLASAEHTLAIRHAQTAAEVVASNLLQDGELPPGLAKTLHVDHLQVIRAGEVVYRDGLVLPEPVSKGACDTTPSGETRQTRNGEVWAVSCVVATRSDHAVIAAWRPNFGARIDMGLLILTLAAIVGIVTALGLLRMLSPLSRVSRALDRVGAGERGVRLSKTGLAELDDLVDRLNAAARALEDREETFLERIQIVQEMSRLVAHEVRNPLQSLELLTSLIVSEEDAQEREELADAIHREIRALDMVVDRLLRQGVAAGGLSLIKTRQTLLPLIKQVMALRSPEAKAQGITLERGPISQRTISIDPALLGRSIENLVLNAMQAVPPRRGLVRVSVTEEDQDLCITVEDNGPGVPSAFGDHIYEPNVSGRTGGTGLGLSLVKGVIEAHGGYIEHDSSPLGGARFQARIPIHEEEDGGR